MDVDPRCGPLLVAAVGITLVSLTDTIATSAAFAARRGDDVDPNQEMIGLGAANLAAGFLQGFAVSTSGSRTAVAEQSGAKSQLTGLVGAGLVVTLLVLFQSLLADLPQSALAAVVIAAALSLLNLGALRRYASVRTVRAPAVAHRVRRRDRARRAAGHRRRDRPVGADVLPAQLVAARRGARSRRRHRRVAQRRGVPRPRREVPGVVVYRWEAPLFFANAGAFRDQVRRLVHERHPTWFVLVCEAITDVDVTAAGMLEQLDNELNAAGVHMAFVEMRTRLQDLVEKYGLFADARQRPLLPERRRGARGDRGGRAMSDTIRREGVDPPARGRAGEPRLFRAARR